MTKKNKLPKPALVRSSAAEYLTFVAASGSQEVSVQMRYEGENIWLTQKMMAQIYDVDVRTVSEHLRNIFQATELEELSVIRNFRITAADGKNYQVKHYNLQATIAVGFKVENERAKEYAETEFEKYRIVQDRIFESDFDRLLKKVASFSASPEQQEEPDSE